MLLIALFGNIPIFNGRTITTNGANASQQQQHQQQETYDQPMNISLIIPNQSAELLRPNLEIEIDSLKKEKSKDSKISNEENYNGIGEISSSSLEKVTLKENNLFLKSSLTGEVQINNDGIVSFLENKNFQKDLISVFQYILQR